MADEGFARVQPRPQPTDDAIGNIQRRRAMLLEAAQPDRPAARPTAEPSPAPAAGSSFSTPPRLEGESIRDYAARMKATFGDKW